MGAMPRGGRDGGGLESCRCVRVAERRVGAPARAPCGAGQGDDGDNFYLVYSGDCDIFVDQVGRPGPHPQQGGRPGGWQAVR